MSVNDWAERPVSTNIENADAPARDIPFPGKLAFLNYNDRILTPPPPSLTGLLYSF